MKLTKLTKLILWIIYYCVIAGVISLIYIFRNNSPVLISMIVIGVLILIAGAYVSFKSKDFNQELAKSKTTDQKKTILNYVNKVDGFEYDDTRYTKYIKFNGVNVLETYDFKSFKPIAGRKRGIKLFDGEQVVKYLKTVKLNSK